MVNLSIIIPYYNTKKYTDELLKCLDKQINDDNKNHVQIMLIYDAGTEPYVSEYKWLEIYEQPERGLSKARNYGIQLAQGEYIAFIDSDDLVTDTYIKNIINKIDTEDFDLCQMSWKTIPGCTPLDVKLNNKYDNLPEWNLACWSRVYRREMIKDVTFPDGWDEDVPFVRTAKLRAIHKTVIPDYMYLYRTEVPTGRTQRHLRGEKEF